MNTKGIISEASSSLLILLYGYTAISKAMDTAGLRHAIAESLRIQRGADFIAWLVILAEAMIVLLLLFHQTRRTGLFASLALLTTFTVYLFYMVLFVSKLPCSCGGVISKLSWQQHIGFNFLFLGINVVGIWAWRSFHSSRKMDVMFYDSK